MEKIYNKVISASAVSLVCGIVTILVGVSTGILLIISSARLLSSKKDMDV